MLNKVKTSVLTGAALDWAVAECEYNNRRYKYGSPCFDPNTKRVYKTEGLQQIGVNFAPSTDWLLGGPIIEREGIYLWRPYGVNGAWSAKLDSWQPERVIHDDKPLIAAMRCYVASKLGDTVDIPKELM